APPLSFPTRRSSDLPLLGEGRGVQDQHAVGLAQFGADLADQFVQQGIVVPEGLAQELLQRLPLLVMQVSNGLGVLVVQVGQQPRSEEHTSELQSLAY